MKSSIIKELIVLLKRDKNQRKKNFFYCQKEVVNAHITYKKKNANNWDSLQELLFSKSIRNAY